MSDNGLRIQTSGTRIRTFLVFLNIEPAEHHDGFLSKDAALDFKRLDRGRARTVSQTALDQKLQCCHSLAMNVQNASRTAKTLVPAAKVDLSHTVLSQGRSTHDTRLDSDVEVCLMKDAKRVLCDDLGDANEFGMTRTLG